MNLLNEVVELSRRYGAGTDWVIAGGGNSSIKNERSMWVKASGTTLAEITPEQLVEMDRAVLAAIWETDYPADSAEREARALADLLAARVAGDGAPRPSVETLMHALFPHRFVLHTHPTIVNGLTCAVGGESAARRLFGDRHVWIPTINPGYTLAADIRHRVEAWREAHDGEWPQILFMQNHGLVVTAESVEEIDQLNSSIDERLRAEIERTPRVDPTETSGSELGALAADVLAAVGTPEPRSSDDKTQTAIAVASGFTNDEVVRRTASREAVAPISSAFTPDHIVYSGHAPCYVAEPGADRTAIAAAIAAYRRRENADPKIVLIAGRGAVALGANARKAEIARLLFLDTLKVACYAESFGGSLFMPPDQIDFIRGWEVERFRERQST